MPVRSSTTGSAAAVPSCYPKLLQARVSGNVWLVTAPKTGVVVHVGPGAKDAKIGYTSRKLVEAKLAPFSGEVKLAA
jgi:hypothetical protein